MLNPFTIAVLVVGGLFLTRGFQGQGQGDQGGSSPLSGFLGAFQGPGGGSPAGGGGSTSSSTSGDPTGIQAASADEDIGIAPQGGLADIFSEPEVIDVGLASTPVISQTPVRVPVALTGTFNTGFNLTGPTAGLTGSTPILVEADSPAAFSQFSTTPEVLAAYLSDPLGPAAPGGSLGSLEKFNAEIQANAPAFDTDLI